MAFLSSKARRNPTNDEVSRLLDPVYSSHSKYSPIVKDSHGNFHDPDYRPFTPISPKRPTSPRRVPSPRPYWETISMNTNDDDEDEEDEDNACDERRLSDGYAYSSMYAHRRVSTQYRRDTRYSYAHTTYSNSYSPSTLVEYSPPASYDSEVTVLSEEPFVEKDKHTWTAVLKRRRKEKSREREEVTCEEDQDEDTSNHSPIPLPVVKQEEEYVPTCGEVFQRRWRTFCFAFNLSVFRAQRRMKHRVHSLMASS